MSYHSGSSSLGGGMGDPRYKFRRAAKPAQRRKHLHLVAVVEREIAADLFVVPDLPQAEVLVGAVPHLMRHHRLAHEQLESLDVLHSRIACAGAPDFLDAGRNLRPEVV